MKKQDKPFTLFDLLPIFTLVAVLVVLLAISGCGVIRSVYKMDSSADKYYGQLERTGPQHVSPNINVIYPVYVIQQVPNHD